MGKIIKGMMEDQKSKNVSKISIRLNGIYSNSFEHFQILHRLYTFLGLFENNLFRVSSFLTTVFYCSTCDLCLTIFQMK